MLTSAKVRLGQGPEEAVRGRGKAKTLLTAPFAGPVLLLLGEGGMKDRDCNPADRGDIRGPVYYWMRDLVGNTTPGTQHDRLLPRAGTLK